MLINAFVISRLDNCNSLMYGLPKYLIDRVQHVFNCAAKLITLTKKYDHVTPLLIELNMQINMQTAITYVKNPNWLEENQLSIYRARPWICEHGYREKNPSGQSGP